MLLVGPSNSSLAVSNSDWLNSDLLNEKYKKINIINDQISGWAKRVFGKFGALVDHESLKNGNEDLVKVFEGMSTVACQELEKLTQTQEEAAENEMGVEYGDVFTDFATEDFIQKNIRVRPVSGVTHGDETRDGRASNVSKGVMGSEANEDGEEATNWNKIANLELEDQRKAIKLKQREV